MSSALHSLLSDWLARQANWPVPGSTHASLPHRECSALLRRLRHETTKLRQNLRAFALRALHLTRRPLRDGHDQFEWLVAVLAHELVTRHGTSLVLSSSLPQRRGVQAETSDGGPGDGACVGSRALSRLHRPHQRPQFALFHRVSSLARPTGRVVRFLTVSRNEVSRTRASVRTHGTSMRAATDTSPSRRDRCP